MKRPRAALLLLGLVISSGIMLCSPLHTVLSDDQPTGPRLVAGGPANSPMAGDVSTARVSAAAPGPTMEVPLRLHNADRLSVRDYAPGGLVGGGYSAIVLSTQSDTKTSPDYPLVMLAPSSDIQLGRFVSSEGLPKGTTITGIGPQTSITALATTSAKTIVDGEQKIISDQLGMSTMLVFAAPQVLPIGAQVSGPGVAPGTTVVQTSEDYREIFLNQSIIQDIKVGTSIRFTYFLEPVHLSNFWENIPRVGQPIGIYIQDDYLAFHNAILANEPSVNSSGKGARILVPSGTYYLSNLVETLNSTSFELGPNVNFVPGSAHIDAADGEFPSISQLTLLSTGHNSAPTVLNVAQTIAQRNVPDVQGQAFLISQLDSCYNNNTAYDGWGCGMVGEEIKQSALPRIRQGAFWEYHGTDTIGPGQAISWAALEGELQNESGFWGAWAGNHLNGNTIGLHIDNIGDSVTHVANSYALDPTGYWHTMAMCEASILDWCIAHGTGHLSNQQPIMDSGIDFKGRVFGSSFIASQTAKDTGPGIGITDAATRTAAVNNDGAIGAMVINTPVLTNQTASVVSIGIEDGGRFNGPVTLSIGAPPQGGTQAQAHVSAYTLRAVQGAAAINADYTNGRNAPVGIEPGTVFELPGGTCTRRPQATYDGKEFIVSAPGLCTKLPNDGIHKLEAGMIRNQLRLSYVSGGSGAPPTLPVVEPLYGIASVKVDDQGSGYNAEVPPDILGKTSPDAKTRLWTGIIYTPIHLIPTIGTATPTPILLEISMKLATLPLHCTAGQIVFVSDARNIDESPGSGSGALAYCTTKGKWFANGMALRN